MCVELESPCDEQLYCMLEPASLSLPSSDTDVRAEGNVTYERLGEHESPEGNMKEEGGLSHVGWMWMRGACMVI